MILHAARPRGVPTLLALAALLACLAAPPSYAVVACDGLVDVTSADSYCPAVTWLLDRGISVGCSDHHYCPNDPVSRAQMALFLNRALKQFGTDTSYATTGLQPTDCAIGQILLTAGSHLAGVPAAGQVLDIADNTTLFYLIGNRFGGDGVNTFALPDLRSAAPSGTTYMICVTGTFPGPSS